MSALKRKLLSQPQRLSVPDALFGVVFQTLEPYVYRMTDSMAAAYKGAYWNMFTLSNGGFYMSPDTEKRYIVECVNQYRGDMSADALGIVACLCAYSHLSFRLPEQHARKCAEHFHLLRAYALEHSEVVSIFGAID